MAGDGLALNPECCARFGSVPYLWRVWAINSIRLQNFRAFEDTGVISLKPLTVVVGRNSVGKSSLARFWPLLRQSIETRTSSPFLWYGRYVDFGSFDTAVHGDKEDVVVGFGFDRISRGGRRRDYTVDGVTADVEVTVARSGKGWDVSAELNVAGTRVRVREQAEGVLLETASPSESVLLGGATLSKVHPIPVVVEEERTTSTSFEEFKRLGEAFGEERRLRDSPVFGLVRELTGKRASEGSVLATVMALKFSGADEFVGKNASCGGVTWKNRLRNNPEVVERLRLHLLMLRVPQILTELRRGVTLFAGHCRWVGPSRALAERYYRRQDLAVDELDPTGANLPVLLSSFSASRAEKFEAWLMRNFGFSVRLAQKEGHLSVQVRDHDVGEEWLNLADVGFGFSQILPVVASLWIRTHERRDRYIASYGSMMSLEQPELHLHPRMQARLGRVLALTAALLGGKSSARLFVETHSQSLVNAVGEAVSAGQLPHDLVQILVVDRKPGETASRISTASFDEEGVLVGWPFGFFSPGVPE